MSALTEYGDDLQRNEQYVLSAEEQMKLYNEYKNGNEDSKTELAGSFLKLAYGIVLEYVKKLNIKDDVAMDLVQESYFGILNGIENYDESRGTMSTIVYLYVRKAIIDYAQKELFRNSNVSLEAELGQTMKIDNDDITIADTIPQTAFDEPETAILKKDLHETVEKYISMLNENQQKIVRLYMELGSFTEVANRLNISKQAVNKTYLKALQTIRKKADIKVA